MDKGRFLESTGIGSRLEEGPKSSTTFSRTWDHGEVIFFKPEAEKVLFGTAAIYGWVEKIRRPIMLV